MLAACLQLGDAACGRTQLNSEDTGAQSPDTPRGTKARYTSTLLDVCLKPNTPLFRRAQQTCPGESAAISTIYTPPG